MTQQDKDRLFDLFTQAFYRNKRARDAYLEALEMIEAIEDEALLDGYNKGFAAGRG